MQGWTKQGQQGMGPISTNQCNLPITATTAGIARSPGWALTGQLRTLALSHGIHAQHSGQEVFLAQADHTQAGS